MIIVNLENINHVHAELIAKALMTGVLSNTGTMTMTEDNENEGEQS